MRLTSNDLDISKSDPFKNDQLNRKENVLILTDVIETSEDSFVLAVNSPYGTGKTTFLRMWKAYLESKEVPCLIYNAWENDYSDSPLLTLIAELERQIQKKGLNTSERAVEIFQSAKSLGSTLIKKSVPLSIRLLTGGLLNLKDEDVEKTITEIFENTAVEGIDDYIKEQDNIESFKQRLSEFVDSLNEQDFSKLIIFVDELDRCKPSFAVRLLEEIKHIFDIPNIYFILAVDSLQLNNSLKSIYGKDLDVKGYLKRFIDLEYQLPQTEIEKFVKLTIEELGLEDIRGQFQDEKKQLIDSSVLFHQRFSLSLRDLEHIYRKVLVVFKSSDIKEAIHPHLLLFLIVLKDQNERNYDLFVNQVISIDELMNFLTQDLNTKSLGNNYLTCLNIVKAYIIWYLDPDYLDQFYDGNGWIKEELDEEKRLEIKELYRLLGHIEHQMSRLYRNKKDIIEKLTNKINMLTNLKEG